MKSYKEVSNPKKRKWKIYFFVGLLAIFTISLASCGGSRYAYQNSSSNTGCPNQF